MPDSLLQTITSPRQVGKTTTALQIKYHWLGKTYYANADEPLPPSSHWITHHWEIARAEGELKYWRKGDYEVDFIFHTPSRVVAIEVKSGRMKRPKGLEQFIKLSPNAIPLIIGGSGVPLEEFFSNNPRKYLL